MKETADNAVSPSIVKGFVVALFTYVILGSGAIIAINAIEEYQTHSWYHVFSLSILSVIFLGSIVVFRTILKQPN
jgi:hypothetical protein